MLLKCYCHFKLLTFELALDRPCECEFKGHAIIARARAQERREPGDEALG